MILKSLLARAECSQYLTNGCVNSDRASRDELLIALGLEVKDAILKLLKEKASEERILLSLRATICKMFMSNVEQRSAKIDIEEIYNKKKRKRKNKKKKDEVEVEIEENNEFNEHEHNLEKMQEEEEDNNNFQPFQMQPVEYRIVEDNIQHFKQTDKVEKTRKENLEPEDVYFSEDANVYNYNDNDN